MNVDYERIYASSAASSDRHVTRPAIHLPRTERVVRIPIQSVSEAFGDGDNLRTRM
jgi:hypothetical protein